MTETVPEGEGQGLAAAAAGTEGEVQLQLIAPASIEDVPVLYANHAQVTYTPEDFTLHLGWYAIPPFAQPPEGPVAVPIRPLAKVVLPLNLVRGVITILENQLQAWEQSFGMPIPRHPNPPERREPGPPQESAE